MCGILPSSAKLLTFFTIPDISVTPSETITLSFFDIYLTVQALDTGSKEDRVTQLTLEAIGSPDPSEVLIDTITITIPGLGIYIHYCHNNNN